MRYNLICTIFHGYAGDILFKYCSCSAAPIERLGNINNRKKPGNNKNIVTVQQPHRYTQIA